MSNFHTIERETLNGLKLSLKRDDAHFDEVMQILKTGTHDKIKEVLRKYKLLKNPFEGVSGPCGQIPFLVGDSRVNKQFEYDALRDILIIREAFISAKELVATSKKLSLWRRSQTVNGEGSLRYQTSRTSSWIPVTRVIHQELDCFEKQLTNVFHEGVRFYMELNKHLTIKQDEGYQLLQYDPGQKFDCHVDAISGHPDLGTRLLSGIIYLNGDYEGGETCFESKQFSFKGQAGDLILFPALFTHPHAGLPVKSGTKYVVVTWFY